MAGPHGLHRSLPLGPERLSGFFPVRSTVKNMPGQPHEELRGSELRHYQDGTFNKLRDGELIGGLELLSLRRRRLPHEGGHAE